FGVFVFSVGILNVEGCVIGGLANTALNFVGAGQLFVSDTVLSDSFFGLRAEGVSAGSRAHVSVHNCQIKNNFDGIIAFDYVRLSVSDSMISGNVGGVTEDSNISSAVNVTLNNCLIANNSSDGIGNAGSGSGTTRVSNCDVANNGKAFAQADPHVIESYGNNRTRGNANSNTGTITQVTTD